MKVLKYVKKSLIHIFVILLIIFLVEVLIMIVLLNLKLTFSFWMKAFIDALMLALISAPFIWQFVINPIEVRAHKNRIQLEADVKALKKANLLSKINSAVMKTTTNGIVITDQNLKIISINPGFSLVTGYTFEEVRGKGPDILKSGRQDKDFYKKMWQELESQGSWRGEIWDKNKKGEVYLEWLSITAIKDEQGKIVHYIGIFEDITQRKSQEEQLINLASYDYLTGLYNRSSFETHLIQLIKQIKRDNEGLCLLFIDLDNFKNMNDKYGHDIGDKVLIYVAQKFRTLLREEDVIARFGGDEFAIALKTKQANENIEPLLEKLVNEVSTPFVLEGNVINIGISIGVAIYSDVLNSKELLLKSADKAMYFVKTSGRNNYKIY